MQFDDFIEVPSILRFTLGCILLMFCGCIDFPFCMTPNITLQFKETVPSSVLHSTTHCVHSPSVLTKYSLSIIRLRAHSTPSNDSIDRRYRRQATLQKSFSKRLSDIPKDSPIYLLSYLPPLQVISDDSSLSSGGSFSLLCFEHRFSAVVFFSILRKSSAIFVIFQYFSVFLVHLKEF